MVKTKRKRKALRVCHPNAAGIDIGANEHWLAVSLDCDDSPVRPFGTFTSYLQRLADWLAACGVRTSSGAVPSKCAFGNWEVVHASDGASGDGYLAFSCAS